MKRIGSVASPKPRKALVYRKRLSKRLKTQMSRVQA